MIDMKIKSMFFDSKRVIDAMDNATRRGLAKAAGFVRKTAMRSIKSPTKKTKNSLEGMPPKSRTGRLKKNIFFGFDRSISTVIIGPVKRAAKGRDIPNTLEFGGTGTTPKGKRFKIAPRPFMQPALIKMTENNKLPKLWKNSITRGR